ncbi:MAG: hypothetical protein EAX90_14025 [Candidatus Heimdallarchaeota archaeon]|nr:hypothetical protein [Candidatus Heimdallarchaeota archaeon]
MILVGKEYCLLENETNTSLIKMNPIHPKDLTKEDWFEDFISFYDVMRENYPYFWVKERMLGYNWLDLKDKYLKRLEKTDDILEILDVFWDAVCALQDTHTSIWLPHWMSYFFREDSFFQQRQLYRTIFSDTLKEASEYWKPIMEKSYQKRNAFNFDALILYIKGDYILVDGHGDWNEKYGGYGTKIIAVNDIPIDIAIVDTYEKVIIKWDYVRKKPYQIYIDPTFFGDSAVFTIVTPEGETKKVSFSASIDYNYPKILKYPSEWLSTKIWPEKKIAYIRFRNFELDYVDKQRHEFLLAFYKQVKDFNHLIIDVRGNSGGWNDVWVDNIIAPLIKKKTASKMYVGFRNGSYVNSFRKEANVDKMIPKENFNYLPPEALMDDFTIYDYTIAVEPAQVIDFNAKIILLIDSFTWSASAAFALFCKETKLATLYGTATKGEAISSGTIFYVLPNSKIAIRFNPCLGIDYTGHAVEEVKVQPDIYYESELNNHDELLEFVFKELEKEKK